MTECHYIENHYAQRLLAWYNNAEYPCTVCLLAECHYAEYCAKCHVAKCHYVLYRSTECFNAECQCAECCYAEYR